MTATGSRRVWFVCALLTSITLLLSACAEGGDDATGSDTSAATEATDADATSSSSATTRPATPLEISTTSDVRYHDDIPGLHPSLLDVYAPTDPGPWPVVVAFHGGDGYVQTKATTAVMAQFLASQGAVVFAPSVGGGWAGPQAPPEIMQAVLSQVPCAIAFAAEHAPEYGGDPEDINVYGYSGGARSAGVAVWGATRGGDGCHATVPAPAVESAVLFEGDWLIAPSWDDAIASGALPFSDITIWDELDRDLDTEVVIVIGTEPQGPSHRMPVGDLFSETDCGGEGEGWVPVGGTCRYFDLRDPDGSLRRVMADRGWLDDGFWDISEVSHLLADRLAAAGHEPEVVEVAGLNHASNDQTRTALVGPVVVDAAIG